MQRAKVSAVVSRGTLRRDAIALAAANFTSRGSLGLTDEELARVLSVARDDATHVRARLAQDGFVVANGRTRGRSDGKPAPVFVTSADPSAVAATVA